MSTSQVASTTTRYVRPILSIDRSEARRRVLGLYKNWFRQIPYIGKNVIFVVSPEILFGIQILAVLVTDYDIPKSAEQCRDKLREEFKKHGNIKDIRVIDMLVIKVR